MTSSKRFLKAKSLERSPAVGYFYGTGIEIWAEFGPICFIEKFQLNSITDLTKKVALGKTNHKKTKQYSNFKLHILFPFYCREKNICRQIEIPFLLTVFLSIHKPPIINYFDPDPLWLI